MLLLWVVGWVGLSWVVVRTLPSKGNNRWLSVYVGPQSDRRSLCRVEWTGMEFANQLAMCYKFPTSVMDDELYLSRGGDQKDVVSSQRCLFPWGVLQSI